MTRNNLLLAIILNCLLFSCGNENQAPLEPNEIVLIPEPSEVIIKDGVFEFNSETRFVITNEKHKTIVQQLTSKFASAAGFKPQIVSKPPEKNYIVLNSDDELGKESYTLNVSTNTIEVKAGDYSGFVYAIETIRQLLPPEIENQKEQPDSKWFIPNLEINDSPRYPWRGLMLDVSRHFFDKEYIMKSIDRMALFKLNTLHLHLVDDQGWRIEIKKFPKLTEVGAFRVNQEEKHWNAREKNKSADKATFGGFYTQEDIKEIVAYATQKGITVVPEIEMPAHVMSALAAYPEFSCFEDAISVPSGGVWPITDIYCPGKEKTFEFLQDVLLEVMDLFPSKYIHVGGDEATRTNWEKCPHCQKRMKSEGLKNTEELQSYMIKRMERFISSKGRILLGWDEILEGGLAPGATVMSWRGIKGGWEASKEGHDVVMTPSTVYLNQYQGEPDYEPIAFGGYEPLRKVYHFDPVVDSMSVEQKKHILGSQANLWSEFVTTTQESEYMLYPRVPALAEALWTPKKKKDWNRFSKKIPSLFKRFDAMGITYARSAYAVTATSKLHDDGSIEVNLNNEFPESEIRFTRNGEQLNNASQLYDQSLKFNNATILKAAVFNNGEIVGDTLEKTFNFHKAVGKKVTYEPLYTERYQGTGANNMVNVLRGSKNFHDGQWQAWLEDDAEITMDLEKNTQISSVAIGSMENQGSGIYYPTQVRVLVSDDDKSYSLVGETNHIFKDNGYVALKDFRVDFNTQNARYVKLKVSNLAHPPTGGSCFMFLDEIIVE